MKKVTKKKGAEKRKIETFKLKEEGGGTPKKNTKFDPNAKASGDNIFGLNSTFKDSKVIFLPVPWDVTTSYHDGTHRGPKAILQASSQIDLFDLEYGNIYKSGLFMLPLEKWILSENAKLRKKAQKIIAASEDEMTKSKNLIKDLALVNLGSEKLNDWVYAQVKAGLDKDKIVSIIGGDHSTPYGAIRAYAEKFPGLGILHLDAHSDTRDAYMGFQHSHASIMRNVLEGIPQISKLIQVGIRDFCEEEYFFTQTSSKVETYFDRDLGKRKIMGESFSKISEDIIKNLPHQVYISFDVDGLDPKYCPGTGTPVLGGLEYHEFTYLLGRLVESGREIVGFDLVEVSPRGQDEWDANVGMRLLYKMAGAALKSLKLA